MYNNPYVSAYNPQSSLDRINSQMAELQRMKEQLQQPVQPTPTNLTQNFQISPTNRDVIRYAGSIDEVQRDMVIGDTPYFSKDMSVVWIKNTKGDIKTYELDEIIPMDDKDLQIQYLQSEIEELKGKIEMNNLLQMMMGNLMKQAPQKMMGQLEQQLKRVNPQAYQEFQQARKNNQDPQEYLNKIMNGFNPEQQQQWNNIMNAFNNQQKQG